MLSLNYDYRSCVAASEKASWRLDDVMPPGTSLDFSRPFLPERLAPTAPLTFLAADERRLLNQIAGNAYLNLFQFVEEFILATMMNHAQGAMWGDPDEMRALARFVDEELKHQQLFHRYRAAFDRDVGHPCGVLENAVEVAGLIMGHSPIAVLIITLHIEMMTQQHYTESVKDDVVLDPLFKNLLRCHWMEESQHARIDALELDKLATENPGGIDTAVGEYLGILAAFDGLLKNQAELDLKSLSTALGGRDFTADEGEAIIASQHRGYRHTFLVTGLTNPTFAAHLHSLSPASTPLLQARAAELS